MYSFLGSRFSTRVSWNHNTDTLYTPQDVYIKAKSWWNECCIVHYWSCSLSALNSDARALPRCDGCFLRGRVKLGRCTVLFWNKEYRIVAKAIFAVFFSRKFVLPTYHDIPMVLDHFRDALLLLHSGNEQYALLPQHLALASSSFRCSAYR